MADILISDGYASQSSSILTGPKLYVRGRAIARNDVALVLVDNCVQVAHVYFHVSIDGEPYSAVSIFETFARRAEALQCKTCDRPELVPSSLLLESCPQTLFAGMPGQVVHVLAPVRWRYCLSAFLKVP